MSAPSSPQGAELGDETNPQGKRYTCAVCGVKLSRLAHLHRHQLQHSSPKESFQCHVCNKSFNRKDVYQRHLRAVHRPNQSSQRRSWRKSCQRCIRYKLKCSRELPCTSCLQKQIPCSYDSSVKPMNQAQDQTQAQTQPRPPWQLNTPRTTLPLDQLPQNASPASTFGSPGSNHRYDYPPSSQEPLASSTSNTMPVQLDHAMHDMDNNDQTGLYNSNQHHDMNMMPHGYHQSHSPDWNFQNPMLLLDSDQRRSQIEENEFPWLDNLSLDLEAFDSSMFRASKMDWLGCETDFSDQHTLPPLSGNEAQSLYDDNLSCRDDLMGRGLQDGGHNPADISHLDQSSNAIRGQEKEDKLTWPAVLDRGGNEMWPFDYASNKGFRKIKLPPLRDILEQTVGHPPPIKTSTVKDLIRVLSTPLIPSLNDSPALEALPAVAFLGQLVKTYFAEFHSALPIVHVPTWKIEKCPSSLLAAMACIGAVYSTADGSQEVASLLAEITQRSLFWMGQADSRSFRNPAYIAASCLHQIYALGSGNRRLYELADASRGLLVTGLRELGVLSSDQEQNDNQKIDFQGLKKMDIHALEQAWNRWRDSELERRVAWSVFEFDCALSTLTRKRGTFSISELPTKLPCSESLWEAPSAKAWASMVSFSASPPTGIPFYPLLRKIIAHKTTLDSVPAWAKRICALVISRLLWDLREMEDASAPDVLGLQSLAESHKASRETLLGSLISVSDALSRPTSTYEVINMNIACSTAYFTHISSGDETLDLVTFIFRNNYPSYSSSSPSQLGKELTRACEHLRLRFTRNPVATRRSVRHAALVIGISRECTSFTPCETMRVFFSFAFLLAFARFFPFDRLSTAPQEHITVKLDELPHRQSETAKAAARIEHWILNGGPASLDPVADICKQENFSALKGAALRAMEDLRVWGLAKKFYRILNSFNYD